MFIMCLTRASVGPSASWRVRESLWRGSRKRTRTEKFFQCWHLPVQVFPPIPVMYYLKVLLVIFFLFHHEISVVTDCSTTLLYLVTTPSCKCTSFNMCMICTGWICYAEKTHGEFILPYVSTTRSPQQMMGSLVKCYFAEQQVGVC